MRMIGHAVRLALAVAIVAWTASAPMAQRRPPSGFVTDALADLVLNKYRPIPNFEKFHDWLGDPKKRQDVELEDDLKDLARWREREGKNWQALEAARRANLARAPFDKVIAIARMMGVAGERQAAIDSLKNRENMQFFEQNGFPLYNPLFVPTKEEERIKAQWLQSAGHGNFQAQEQALAAEYEARVQQILTDFKNKTNPSDREVDRLQHETFTRIKQIVAAEREVRAELDQRRNPAAAPAAPASQPGSTVELTVTAVPAKSDIAVGEAADIDITIDGGTPPYHITVRRLEGDIVAEFILSEAGKKPVQVPSFTQPGEHTIYVSVQDEGEPPKNGQATAQFHVTGEEQAPPPAVQPPPPPPQPVAPPKPPVPPPPPPPPPVAEKFTPRVLPAGTYQALLWPGVNLLQPYYKDSDKKLFPSPVTLTLDAGGGVTGTSRWQLSPAERGPTYLDQHGSNQISFRLEGKIDWSTGAIALRLLDGIKVEGSTDVGGWWRRRYDYEFTLSGWQLGHPALKKPLIDLLSGVKQAMPERLGNLNDAALPHFEIDAAGGLKFRDEGFAGMADYDRAAHTFRAGAGGSSHIKVNKFVNVSELYQPPRRTEDEYGNQKSSWEAQTFNWYLRILGRAEPPKPPPPVDDNGELAAFGLWPKSPLSVRAGDTFSLDAMGVYLDDPFEAVKLNNRVTWEPGAGVTRSASGDFRAAVPGRYQVKVTIRRKGAGIMSDTIDVIVGP